MQFASIPSRYTHEYAYKLSVFIFWVLINIFFSYRVMYTYIFMLKYYMLHANAYLNLSSIIRAFLTQCFEAQLILFSYAFPSLSPFTLSHFWEQQKICIKPPVALHIQYFKCHKKKERNWLEFPFSFDEKHPHKYSFLSSNCDECKLQT